MFAFPLQSFDKKVFMQLKYEKNLLDQMLYVIPFQISISHVKKRSLYTINSDKLQTPTMYKKWYDRWIYSSDMII